MEDIKQRTIQSGMARLVSQSADVVTRTASIIVMSRLLDPKDFGLVAMVTVITGLYGLFVSAGLSQATVQAPTVTDEQLSLLFWINMAVGIVLSIICILSAPILVKFYDEPRLFWITLAVGSGFIVNAAAVQHYA